MDNKELGFLIQFLTESDAIEGIPNDTAVLRWQFADDRCIGHAGALRRARKWADHKVPLTEETIMLVQKLITSEQHLKGERKLADHLRGRYRPFNIYIAESDDITRPRRRIGEDHPLVPGAMADLVRETAAWQVRQASDDPAARVRSIARFHWRYERIHPFADGNGRSGRALVYYLYRYAGLPLFVFTYRDRHRNYYPCFADGTGALMERYFLDRMTLTATP